MSKSQPKFQKGDYISVYLGTRREPQRLQIINIYHDKFHDWCYVLLAGNHPITVSEKDLTEFFRAISSPPDETH